MVDGALMLTMLVVSTCLVTIILFGGRKPRRAPVTARQSPAFDPGDLSDLTDRFKAIDREHRQGRIRQTDELHRRLDQLILSRAPVRGIAGARDPNATNIRFADGTTLRVRTDRDHLTAVAEAAGREPVWLSAYRIGPPGLRLSFDSRHGRVATVQLGVDHSR